jgi:hypothetical protein
VTYNAPRPASPTLTGVSKTWKIVIFSLVGAFLLCCGGGGAGLYFITTAAVKEPKAAAGDFLTALEAGNTEDAYSRLCRSVQTGYGPEKFAETVKQRPPASHELAWGGSYDNSNGLETAAITASITYKDGSKSDHQVRLRKESGTWKVCGDPY